MVNARLHVICGNCGCNDMFEVGSATYDDHREIYISCHNCSTLHCLSDKAKIKDSDGARSLGVKPIDKVLSAREVEYVKAVCAFPGAKYPTSHYPCEHQDDELLPGEEHEAWYRPEELGLIESVGSYKWKPGKKLRILYAMEDGGAE